MIPKINWNPSKKELTQFRWIFLIGFGLIGALFFLKGKTVVSIALEGTAIGVWMTTWCSPLLGKGLYRVWMGFGFVMGTIVSQVVMVIIFYLVLTPIALFFKVVGRDALERRKKDSASFWRDHPKISDPTYYDHLS